MPCHAIGWIAHCFLQSGSIADEIAAATSSSPRRRPAPKQGGGPAALNLTLKYTPPFASQFLVPTWCDARAGEITRGCLMRTASSRHSCGLRLLPWHVPRTRFINNLLRHVSVKHAGSDCVLTSSVLKEDPKGTLQLAEALKLLEQERVSTSVHTCMHTF